MEDTRDPALCFLAGYYILPNVYSKDGKGKQKLNLPIQGLFRKTWIRRNACLVSGNGWTNPGTQAGYIYIYIIIYIYMYIYIYNHIYIYIYIYISCKLCRPCTRGSCWDGSIGRGTKCTGLRTSQPCQLAALLGHHHWLGLGIVARRCKTQGVSSYDSQAIF